MFGKVVDLTEYFIDFALKLIRHRHSLRTLQPSPTVPSTGPVVRQPVAVLCSLSTGIPDTPAAAPGRLDRKAIARLGVECHLGRQVDAHSGGTEKRVRA